MTSYFRESPVASYPSIFVFQQYLDRARLKLSKGIKMNKLLGASLILGAISMSKQAGYSSSNNSEAPAIRKYKCNVVEGKKPWCACRSSKSSATIDLSSLGKNLEASIPSPKFRSKPVQGWSIAWTPCEDFDMFTNITLNPDVGEKACKGVGFARYTETSAKICNGYGSHETSAKFYSHGYDGTTGKENFYIDFLYSKAAQERRARIQLICTPNTDETSFEYLGDKAGLEVANFSSKCCCSNKVCSKNGNHSHKKYQVGGGVIAGISVAVISVIIVIVIVIAAVVYKRRHRIPHPVQVGAQEHDERYPILG